MKVRSRKLTICRVSADGAEVGLEFLDSSGTAVTVELPIEQAEVVAMTLPHLLARALKRKTGDDNARYVFDLGEWSIEGTAAGSCLIATLKTVDGFEVSFGMPFEACRSLGRNLLVATANHCDGENWEGRNEGICPLKFN